VITEHTIMSDKEWPRGWIFYDADCALCVGTMRRVRRLLEKRGFRWVPLQTPGTAVRLGVREVAFETRMHVLTDSGRVYQNADALGALCRSVWWLWPFGALLALPGFLQAGRLGYNWLARNRYCLGGQCDVRPPKRRLLRWVLRGETV
jgi:predicted DCC family thiol-disulfide oxidoreductase YuxK